MRRPEPSRRAARPLVALALVALLASIGANGAARAQSGDELSSQFGGYRLAARGNGLLFAFDAVGFIPGNPRVLQQGFPEAQATGAGGPTNYALSSLDYPGSVLGDPGAIAAQGGAGDNAKYIPSYPVQARAYYPSDPNHVEQPLAGGGMVSDASATTSDATATYSASDLPQFITTSGMAVHANTHLEDGRAVSQLHAEMSDVDFAGIVHIGTVVTDIRADSDGTAAATSGTTTASGTTVLGLPAVIDDTGVHLAQPAPGGGTATTQKPGVLTPLVQSIPGGVPLSGLSDALQPVADALGQLITTTVGSTGSINDLLAEAGVSIRLLQPTEVVSGATGSRTADGVLITLDYNPHTNTTLKALSQLVPSSSLPSQALVPGAPVNSSPQGLVSLLQQVYSASISLVPGGVDATASQPFGSSGPVVKPSTPSTSGTGVSGVAISAAPAKGFTAPAPALPRNGSGTQSPGGTLGDAVPVSFLGDAIGAWLVILLLLSVPLWWALSTRLADRALAGAAAAACPDGLDGPVAPGGGA